MSTLTLLAGIGGLVYNILQLLEQVNIPKALRPDFKDWLYWIPFLIWPLLAALLAYTYITSGLSLSPITALNVGLSAPLIFRQMVSSNPMRPSKINPGQGA